MADDANTGRRGEAVIFDLDGVLTDTARLHYLAWKRLADELSIPFDETTNEKMKGVDRMNSLEIMLGASVDAFSATEKERLAETKNGYYRAAIASLGPSDLLPGAAAALQSVKRAGLRSALASASKNAAALIAQLGIERWFDFIADASRIRAHKPDPEIFLTAAAGLGVAPEACVGVEDSAAGIAAIKAAGMRAIGVGRARDLVEADLVIDSIARFRVADLPRLFWDRY